MIKFIVVYVHTGVATSSSSISDIGWLSFDAQTLTSLLNTILNDFRNFYEKSLLYDYVVIIQETRGALSELPKGVFQILIKFLFLKKIKLHLKALFENKIKKYARWPL